MAVSRERRRHVAGLVRRVGLHQADLTQDARLLYIVGALVASDGGVVRRKRLDEALRDEQIMQIARSILLLTQPGGTK